MKQTINTTIDQCIKKAEELNIKLNLNRNIFTENKLNVLWFGGEIANFNYKDYTISIDAYGDVIADLYINHKLEASVKDENNNAEFWNEMNSYITDEDLDDDKISRFAYPNEGIIKSQEKVLFINSSNWLEFNVQNNKTNEIWDLIDINIIEDNNVLESLKDLSGYIEFIENNKQIYD